MARPTPTPRFEPLALVTRFPTSELNALLGGVATDLGLLVREAVAARPAGRERVAVVYSLALHCQLRGLLLPVSARDREGVTLAYGWSVEDLAEAIARKLPALASWAADLPSLAAAQPDGSALVIVVRHDGWYGAVRATVEPVAAVEWSAA